MALVAEAVRRVGLAAGLDRVGIATAEPFPEVRVELEHRLADGTSGRLGFTYTDPTASTDLRSSFAWAERLVVGARTYLPQAGQPGPSRPGTGRIARFAVADSYAPLRQGLSAVAGLLEAAGQRAVMLYDDNRLVDRAAAVRAGIGWWGKNSMVLAPGLGPWFLIGSVVTDARLEVDVPMARGCGSCSACLPACPTSALVAPGVLDARRCLAAWAQAPGIFPAEYREAMGDRLYGCDDCLDACPPGYRRRSEAAGQAGRVDLVELLAASDRALIDRYARFFMPQRRPRFLRRNAIIALGNTGAARFVPLLSGYLGNPDWLLRLHAAWALGRIGGPLAVAALRARLFVEAEPKVAGEISAALQRPSEK